MTARTRDLAGPTAPLLRRPRRRRLLFAAIGLAMVAANLGPAAAVAHPLGNFTINH